jgi:hypothetical protein
MSKLAYILVLVLVLIIVGPFLTIWALNTLFPALAISYDFHTCLAVVILSGAIGANKISFSSKK